MNIETLFAGRILCVNAQSLPYLYVNEAGEISRQDPIYKGRRMAYSKQWRIAGAVERNNFNRIVRCWTWGELVADIAAGKEIPWRFKNGKPRVCIVDLDHGSMREWGGAVFGAYFIQKEQ